MDQTSIDDLAIEILDHILALPCQRDKVGRRTIMKFLEQRRVSKFFNATIVQSNIWTHIFAHLKNNFSIVPISRGSLLPSTAIGKMFYGYLISSDYCKILIKNDLFNDAINSKHAIVSNPTTKYKRIYPVYAAQDLACFFKACCMRRVRSDEAIKLINNDDILSWIEIMLKNAQLLFHFYHPAKKITYYWEHLSDATFLMHWALTYYLYFGKQDTDRFGNNDLIRACRLGDIAGLTTLLTSNDAHLQLQHSDCINFNPLHISIINHDHEMFDLLLRAINLSYQQSKEFVELSLCVSNNKALKKLLNAHYPKVTWRDYLPFFDHENRIFLEEMLIFAARLSNNNIKALEILFDHGLSPHTTRYNLALVAFAQQAGSKDKIDYIKSNAQFRKFISL